MKLPKLLLMALFASTLCAAQTPVNFPQRPIRLIISSSPGTGADYFGRVIAQPLSEMYKQQVVADNRLGAGGLIAMKLLSEATPDGYTLGTASSSMMVVPLMYAKQPYNPVTDFAPIAMFASIPSVVMVIQQIKCRYRHHPQAPRDRRALCAPGRRAAGGYHAGVLRGADQGRIRALPQAAARDWYQAAVKMHTRLTTEHAEYAERGLGVFRVVRG